MRSTTEILANSAAAETFKVAVLDIEAGRGNPLVEHSWQHPKVKVLRVLLKLLDTHPAAPVQRALIEAQSGCSDFRGRLRYYSPEEHTVRFVWDCAWKAREVGYKLPSGGADQVRAAREFGYECFQDFREEPGAAADRPQ
jgi:hypothetical protein